MRKLATILALAIIVLVPVGVWVLGVAAIDGVHATFAAACELRVKHPCPSIASHLGTIKMLILVSAIATFAVGLAVFQFVYSAMIQPAPPSRRVTDFVRP